MAKKVCHRHGTDYADGCCADCRTIWRRPWLTGSSGASESRGRTPMLDDPELRRLNVSPEQYAAVIDRLAREAGSNPYPDVRDPTTAHARRVWSEGAACGVAAERARTDDVDGWRVYCHNGEDASASIAHVLTPGDSVTFHECDAIHVRFDPLSAALAPERTGEGNDA